MALCLIKAILKRRGHYFEKTLFLKLIFKPVYFNCHITLCSPSPLQPDMHKSAQVPQGRSELLTQPRQQETLCLTASFPEKLISHRIQVVSGPIPRQELSASHTSAWSADLKDSSRLLSAHQLSAITKMVAVSQRKWTHQRSATWMNQQTWRGKVEHPPTPPSMASPNQLLPINSISVQSFRMKSCSFFAER